MARQKTVGDLHAVLEGALGGGVVQSVRIGTRHDRASWSIMFFSSATDEQRRVADGLMAAWSFDGCVEETQKEDSATVRDLALMASELSKAKDELAQIKADMQAFVQAAVAAAVGPKA